MKGNVLIKSNMMLVNKYERLTLDRENDDIVEEFLAV